MPVPPLPVERWGVKSDGVGRSLLSSRSDVIKKHRLERRGTRSHISDITNLTEAWYRSLQFTNSPPCGALLILSVVISLRARRSIDLTYCSVSSRGTGRHPTVKKPDGVVNLVTLDLPPYRPIPKTPSTCRSTSGLAWGRRNESIHGTMWVKQGLSRDPPTPQTDPSTPTSSVLIGRAKQPVNHESK